MGTKDTAIFAADNVEKGKIWVAEIDIQSFFDSINHEKLELALENVLEDERLVSLVMGVVRCKIETEEGVFRLAKGIIQGSPLSPLISNVFLTTIDKLCENKYEGYCRYGDDIRVYTSSKAEARQKYYKCFNIIMPDDNFEFIKRTRRPPLDALNAMISYGNTLLYTRFANLIYQSSLDIRIGILHSSLNRPERLNLDLADLFKPVLVDRTIFTLVNKKMINEVRDFEEVSNGGVYLTYFGKRIFIKEFEKKLSQELTIDGNKISYSDIMIREVRKLNKFFRDGRKYKPYRYVN